MTLNFEGGGDDVPTYSFADLRACAEKGDNEFFRRAFDGKVVLFGTLLETEDRKVTSKRFATGRRGRPGAALRAASAAGGRAIHPCSIAGVYIHATGVNNLIRARCGDRARPRRRRRSRSRSPRCRRCRACARAVGAVSFISVSPPRRRPPRPPLSAGAGVAADRAVSPALAALARRSAIASSSPTRSERFLRKSFGALPRAAGDREDDGVEQAAGARRRDAHHHGVLLGRRRLFLDRRNDDAGRAGRADERISVGDDRHHRGAMAAMSTSISAIPIVAVFGAPVDDPDHAANAVRAALQCRDPAGSELNRDCGRRSRDTLGHRIGLNSGEALVGNIGSHRRFNYTVMSDTVNLASRLEGANKYFGTSIMASETTVRAHRRGVCLARTRRDPGERAFPAGQDLRSARRSAAGDRRADGARPRSMRKGSRAGARAISSARFDASPASPTPIRRRHCSCGEPNYGDAAPRSRMGAGLHARRKIADG